MGDALIADSAALMKSVFDEKTLFRIGGDEFVAVLSEDAVSQADTLMAAFRRKIDEFNGTKRRYEEEVHIAAGITEYDRTFDQNYGDVFRRADSLMYQDKKLQKMKDGGAGDENTKDH